MGRIVRFYFLSNLLLIIFAFSVFGTDFERPKEILILNSYHQTYDWTASILNAVTESISKDYPDLEYQIEYMDTKRLQSESYFEFLFELYSLKYKSSSFNLAFTTDDHAFQFMLKYGDSLFPGVPVVFSGVNSFSEEMLDEHINYTGVVEDIQIKETIDIALTLCPDTDYIFIIGDNSYTARANKERVKQVESLYPPQELAFIYSNGDNIDRVIDELKPLTDKGVILWFGFLIDADGKQYSNDETLELISDLSKLPIFSCWDFTLNHGAVGGLVTSGIAQGRKSAELIKEILSGIEPQHIPVVTKSPNMYMFDKKLMDRFNISLKDLPDSSFVINKPDSFFSQNKKILLWIFALFLLLCLVIIFLLLYVLQKKRAQKKLFAINSLLRSIINSPSDMNIWSVDQEFKYTFFNATHKKSMKAVWGVNIDIGHNFFDYVEANYRSTVEYRYEGALNGDDFYIVTEISGKDGSSVYYDNYSSPIYNEDNEIVGLTVFAIEITKRKMAEDRIYESLKEKEILLKEIHHRVKNNLQIVSSMLNLQKSNIIDSNDRDLFRESINRIDSMSLIHELLYNSENLSSIDMQDYFTDLVSNISNTIEGARQPVSVIFKIDKISLNINIAVPLGLVSNEIITNCYKHAFSGIDNPMIIITMSIEDDGLLLLKIKDNGNGYNTEYDSKKRGALGFELINGLTEQVNGEYEMISKIKSL